jgi:hypothetical protein
MAILALIVSISTFAFEPFPMDQNAARWDKKDSIQKWGTSFHVGTITEGELSPTKITHILVPGSAMGDESDQFFQSALLRAKMYKALYPDHQVVIVSQPDVVSASQEEVFERFNVKIVASENDKLTAGQLLKVMSKFKRIASFDFYGHSSPWALRLGKKNASMYASKAFAALKDHFIDGAYATLNGCNGGFTLAPALSKLWEIPVSGALTGSLFERLQADGMWYKKPDRTRSEWVTENFFNFDPAEHCWSGTCWRMKPQRNNYGSYWGSFKEGGLSFYKFFCGSTQGSDSCFKAMAKSIVSFPSMTVPTSTPSWELYEKKVFDHLCSTAKDPNYFPKCVEGIKAAISRGDKVFTAHNGNALKCDFNKCHATVKCKKKRFSGAPRGGSCRLITEPNPRSTVIVEEYLAYKRGFNLLF